MEKAGSVLVQAGPYVPGWPHLDGTRGAVRRRQVGWGAGKSCQTVLWGGPGLGAWQPIQGTCAWESELGSNPDSSPQDCVTALSELQFPPRQDEDDPVLLRVQGQSSCEKPDTEVSHFIEAGRWSR